MYGVIGKILTKMGYNATQISGCDINGDGDITFGEIKRSLGANVAHQVRAKLPDKYFADPQNRKFPVQNDAQTHIAAGFAHRLGRPDIIKKLEISGLS